MRETVCYGHRRETDRAPGYWYANIYTSAFPVTLCDKKMPVTKLRVVANAPTPRNDNGDASYWGWWDAEKEAFTHVHVSRQVLSMVFPYGLEPEIERGKGLAFPVQIEELGTFTLKESAEKGWHP